MSLFVIAIPTGSITSVLSSARTIEPEESKWKKDEIVQELEDEIFICLIP